jgi:hypothetical protein
VLGQVRGRLLRPLDAHLAWDSFAAAGTGLLLWEAFVSGASKRGDHVADARLAVDAFVRALPDPKAANAVYCTSRVYSLVGAALLRTGWSSDLGLLSQPCLVLKA